MSGPEPEHVDAIELRTMWVEGETRDRIEASADARRVSVREIAEEIINAALDAEGAPPASSPSPRQITGRRPRRSRPRSRTIPMKRFTREELRRGALMFPPVDEPRPTTRSDCEHGINDERPCPWVACKHHLYLDINAETGSIKFNFPDLEVEDLKETCALDVAARGGITLEEVGEIMNLTRERVRQLEVRALLKIKMASPSDTEVGAALLRRPGQ